MENVKLGFVLLVILLGCVSCDSITITETRFLKVDDKVGSIDEVYPPNKSNIATAAPMLNWEEKEHASLYKIQISDYAGFVYSLIIEERELVESQYQIDAALTGDTNYFWRVRAYDSDGKPGSWHGPWQVRICTKIPDLYQWNPTIIHDDSVRLLEWVEILDAEEYRIQVSETAGFSGTLIVDEQDISTPEYQVTEVLEVGVYYWRVQFMEPDDSWSDWSNTFSFSFNITVPDFVVPEDDAQYIDTIDLADWENYEGATAYHFQIADTGEFSNTLFVDNDALLESMYEITEDLSYGTYYCRIKVQNQEGVWSAWGDVRSFEIVEGEET